MADNSNPDYGDGGGDPWDNYGPGDSPVTFDSSVPSDDDSAASGYNDLQSLDEIVITAPRDTDGEVQEIDPNTYGTEFPLTEFPDLMSGLDNSLTPLDFGNQSPEPRPAVRPSGNTPPGGGASRSGGSGGSNNAANPLSSLLNSLFGGPRTASPVQRTFVSPSDRNGVYTLARGASVPGGAGSKTAAANKPGGVAQSFGMKSMLPFLIGGVILLLVIKK